MAPPSKKRTKEELPAPPAASVPGPSARPTLDDKGRDALKATLTSASDILLKCEATRGEAAPVDQAVAFIEMGGYVKARLCLGEALARVRGVGNAAAAALVEEVLRELPAEDATWEVEAPETEDPDGVATFDQEPHKTECTVTIAVPAATTAADVAVVIKRDFLSAAVKGHAKQPHVVYGCLRGNVEVDACAWTLDGAGESRALVVSLEKETDHPCWKKLLADPIDYWKDGADLEHAVRQCKIDDDDANTSPIWDENPDKAKPP